MRLWTLAIVLLAGSLAALSQPARAADFYVAKNGSDANAGSVSAPWLTISKAAQTLRAGDTVYIKAGTYNERVVIQVQGNAASGYITFRNYANDTVIVDGSGITSLGAWPYGGLIDANSKSYLRIQGLHIQNVQGNADGGSSIFITGGSGSSHIEILNNEVSNHSGITAIGCIGGNLSDLLISGNNVHDCDTHAQEGIRIARNVTNFRILNNTVYKTTNIGIDCVSWGSQPMYGLIQGNTCYQNGQASTWAHSIYVDGGAYILIQNNLCYDSEAGIELGAEYPDEVAHHLIARQNVIYGCRQSGITLGGCQACGRIQDCAVVQNTLVNNNTHRDTNQWTSEFSETFTLASSLVRNNIVYDLRDHNLHMIYNAPGNTPGNVTFDYNLYYSLNNQLALFSVTDSTYYNSHSSWQAASGQDSHSLVADPLFTNTANHDFHLQSGSPCIDKGGFLTRTTAAGNGAIIPVSDVRPFCDGYNGFFPGDQIQVGSQAAAKIVHIDYANRTLQVDRTLTWNLNAGVSLPYSGFTPDMGAYESGVSAAAATISGIVIDQASGAAVSGAILSSESTSAITDAGGTYKLTVPAGDRTVGVSGPGYQSKVQTVHIDAGKQLPLNWQLIAISSDAAKPTWRISPSIYIKGKSPGSKITFSDLPPDTEIRIYTVSGKLIQSWDHHAADHGSETWDVADVASGIYLYYLRSQKEEKKGKIIIIK